MKFSLVLIFSLCFTGIVSGQQSSIADSLFEEIKAKYQDKYSQFSESGDRGAMDSIRAIRAMELADLYNQYPETASGREGLVLAFRGWLNVDSVGTMASYINKISPNDLLWRELVRWYNYGLQNTKVDPSFFAEYLKSIVETESVSNPQNLSYIHTRLGRIEGRLYKNSDKAISHYGKVIELNADSVEVEFAKRDIYDLKNLQIGSKLPDFSTTDIYGDSISTENLRGKFILIEFWATWCAPCIPEIPYLKEAYQEYSNRDDFKIIGVSLDESVDKLAEFLRDNDIKWTQIIDNKGTRKWTGKIGNLFAVGNGIPKSFLVDKQGIIVAIDLRKEELTEVLDSFLN